MQTAMHGISLFGTVTVRRSTPHAHGAEVFCAAEATPGHRLLTEREGGECGDCAVPASATGLARRRRLVVAAAPREGAMLQKRDAQGFFELI